MPNISIPLHKIPRQAATALLLERAREHIGTWDRSVAAHRTIVEHCLATGVWSAQVRLSALGVRTRAWRQVL
jgi:hypothetical protein